MVPHFLVERLSLGELPESSAPWVRVRLGLDRDSRLAEIARSNVEILDIYPADTIATRIRNHAELQTRRTSRVVWGIAGNAQKDLPLRKP